MMHLEGEKIYVQKILTVKAAGTRKLERCNLHLEANILCAPEEYATTVNWLRLSYRLVTNFVQHERREFVGQSRDRQIHNNALTYGALVYEI